MFEWLTGKPKEPKKEQVHIYRTETIVELYYWDDGRKPDRVLNLVQEYRLSYPFAKGCEAYPRTHKFDNGCLVYWENNYLTEIRIPLALWEKVVIKDRVGTYLIEDKVERVPSV